MSEEQVNRADRVDLPELDGIAQARVLQFMRHALELVDESQSGDDDGARVLREGRERSRQSVDDALAGRASLSELTAEERALFNRVVTESIADSLAASDYTAELLSEGVDVVYLDGTELIEKKSDGTTRKIR